MGQDRSQTYTLCLLKLNEVRTCYIQWMYAHERAVFSLIITGNESVPIIIINNTI